MQGRHRPLAPSQKRPLRLSEASKNICQDVNQFTSDEAGRRQYQSGTLSEPRPGNNSRPNGDTGIGAWIDEHGLTERISPVRRLPTLLLRSAQ